MDSVNSSFGNTCSLCLSTRPSTMIMETMIHAEIQSEDKIMVNDRATADHVRGCRIPLGCTHLIISWKTVRCRCRSCRTVDNSTSNYLASCWLLVSFLCALHLHRRIIGPIWLCWFYSHSLLAIALPDLVRCKWPYVTHAFRQSADSSGISS